MPACSPARYPGSSPNAGAKSSTRGFSVFDARLRFRDSDLTGRSTLLTYGNNFGRSAGQARCLAQAETAPVQGQDWIKGQITAIETGMLSFDAAFLPYIVLPDGRTVLDRLQEMKLLEDGPLMDRQRG